MHKQPQNRRIPAGLLWQQHSTTKEEGRSSSPEQELDGAGTIGRKGDADGKWLPTGAMVTAEKTVNCPKAHETVNNRRNQEGNSNGSAFY